MTSTIIPAIVSPPKPLPKSRRGGEGAFLPSPNSRKTMQIPSLHVQNCHAHLIKTGMATNVYACNTLIHKYCQSDCIQNAHQLFDEMTHRNLVSWTSLISGYARLGNHADALCMFLDMVNCGFLPNEFAFGSVLRSCSESGELWFGEQLNAYIVKMGLSGNEFMSSGLIAFYAKNRNFDAALGILERMQKIDVFSWTSMIVGYSNGGCYYEAFGLFVRMLEENMTPGEYALTSVLKSCASLKALKEGCQVHSYTIKFSFEMDTSVRTSLVDLYAMAGDLYSARLIFDQSPCHEVVMCTVMIGGYAQNGDAEQALEIFQKMLRDFEATPNEFTYANVISAIAGYEQLNLAGSCLHGLAFKTGHASVMHVGGALITMYAKTGSMTNACKVFENMTKKDAISCSSILAGFSSNGCDQEALEFYSKLHKSSIRPDPFCLASITISCAKLADQLRGKQVHAQVIKQGYEADVCISSALVDMYSRSGTIEDAEWVFEKLHGKDAVAWTAMIDGYAQHGQGRNALELFNRMIEEGVKPNAVTFVSALYACSHAGLVEEGLHYFNLMSSVYGIEPVQHHYACVVDLLGRAGRIEEAREFIAMMPIEPGPLIWRSFLGACKIHKNLELGIYASRHILELQPEDDATYVLLANMYASVGRWSDAFKMRNEMKRRGLRKAPGLSWIEIRGSFHVFGARDSSHPQKEVIYKVLEELNCEMKKAGYIPQTELVLYQVEEKKEKLLCYHSERLAVAFGLISTPQCSPIRIFKNLRVCGDCHNAIKLISTLRERKIVVRDVSRFHHFIDGKCSCGDYW